MKTKEDTEPDRLAEYNFDYTKAKPNRFASTAPTVTVTLDADVAAIFTKKEYRKRNGSGAVYDAPRVAVGAGRVDGVGAQAEA
ncbi:hypothetical protein CEK71_18980 [Methylovulum psychrotolerans]|uniref:Uncharacterized protein n=1 Tax=Methylovulum psychrotolerans TaxID=1704499 RepID=A0A1Z4C390_9GAMM|nr:hypothetical protein CEK71_18980 [Methylovulum psychrotolerans]